MRNLYDISLFFHCISDQENEASVSPEVSLQRMSTISTHTPPAHLMAFTPKGSHLVVALMSGNLSVINLVDGQTNHMERRLTGKMVLIPDDCFLTNLTLALCTSFEAVSSLGADSLKLPMLCIIKRVHSLPVFRIFVFHRNFCT